MPNFRINTSPQQSKTTFWKSISFILAGISTWTPQRSFVDNMPMFFFSNLIEKRRSYWKEKVNCLIVFFKTNEKPAVSWKCKQNLPRHHVQNFWRMNLNPVYITIFFIKNVDFKFWQQGIWWHNSEKNKIERRWKKPTLFLTPLPSFFFKKISFLLNKYLCSALSGR